uniref:Putative secreted protein n=1 Tax=Ixodes ricinus TaxID=34613 RepID=A0A6B0TZ55_IXORI
MFGLYVFQKVQYFCLCFSPTVSLMSSAKYSFFSFVYWGHITSGFLDAPFFPPSFRSPLEDASVWSDPSVFSRLSTLGFPVLAKLAQ